MKYYVSPENLDKWLKDNFRSKKWLAYELDCTQQTISNKIRYQNWSKLEIEKLHNLGILKEEDNG